MHLSSLSLWTPTPARDRGPHQGRTPSPRARDSSPENWRHREWSHGRHDVTDCAAFYADWAYLLGFAASADEAASWSCHRCAHGHCRWDGDGPCSQQQRKITPANVSSVVLQPPGTDIDADGLTDIPYSVSAQDTQIYSNFYKDGTVQQAYSIYTLGVDAMNNGTSFLPFGKSGKWDTNHGWERAPPWSLSAVPSSHCAASSTRYLCFAPQACRVPLAIATMFLTSRLWGSQENPPWLQNC